MLGSGFIEWRGINVRAENQPLSRPGLYVLINLINGKRYVGISQNVRRRLREHSSGTGCAPILAKAFRKYGNGSFVAIPLLYSIDGTDHLPELEAAFIREFQSVSNGYNVQAASGAVGPYGESFGAILKAAKSTPESRKRHSEAQKKHRGTPEARSAQSVSSLELHSRPEVKAKHSASAKAAANTDEAKARASRIIREWQSDPVRKSAAVEKAKTTRLWKTLITDGINDRWFPKDQPLPEGWRRGRCKAESFNDHSTQEKARLTRIGRIIITDGNTERRIYPTDPIPEGWRKGRSKPPSFCNPDFAKYASNQRSGKIRK